MSFVRNILNPYGVPLLSSFSAVNAGGRATTATANGGGVTMAYTNGVAADDFRLLKTVAPSGAYVLTVHMNLLAQTTNYSGGGIVWRQSSNGSAQFFGPHSYNGNINLLIRNESASNNGDSPTFTTGTDLLALVGSVAWSMGQGMWLQFIDDGTTNRVFRVSLDGSNYVTSATTGRTTTITPDEIGLWIGNVNSGGAATASSALFDSWRITQ